MTLSRDINIHILNHIQGHRVEEGGGTAYGGRKGL